MAVRRIVANLHTTDPAALSGFYRELFDLEVLMDHGWITTVGSSARMTVQLSAASEGGAGTPVPALSIEVDDLEAVLARVRLAGIEIVHGPVDEAWGVRRFFIRDPGGRLLNVLQHAKG